MTYANSPFRCASSDIPSTGGRRSGNAWISVNACSPRLSRLRPEWRVLNPPCERTRAAKGVGRRDRTPGLDPPRHRRPTRLNKLAAWLLAPGLEGDTSGGRASRPHSHPGRTIALPFARGRTRRVPRSASESVHACQRRLLAHTSKYSANYVLGICCVCCVGRDGNALVRALAALARRGCCRESCGPPVGQLRASAVWHHWHNVLTEAQLAQQRVLLRERRLALWRRRTRGPDGNRDNLPVRAFFLSLVAANLSVEGLTGQPAAVVRAAPAA
jgi:hypothetical protein